MLEHIRIYESVPKVLSKLKNDGHYVSIVSTKYRARLTQALERDGLTGLVDHIVGGDEVSQNKPDPEGLLIAIDASTFSKSNTIYVGDSESDGERARRAGVQFVAVTTGTTSRANLENWSPISVLSDLSDLR